MHTCTAWLNIVVMNIILEQQDSVVKVIPKTFISFYIITDKI